jgi:hypothetical protein
LFVYLKRIPVIPPTRIACICAFDCRNRQLACRNEKKRQPGKQHSEPEFLKLDFKELIPPAYVEPGGPELEF